MEILSDSEGEQPALSSPAADGNVAQLVDMGFTPDQAAQVRLSEAIQSLMRDKVVKAALDEEAALMLCPNRSCRWVLKGLLAHGEVHFFPFCQMKKLSGIRS